MADTETTRRIGTVSAVSSMGQRWRVLILQTAELIDALRVFPRVFVVGYGYMAWDMHQWVKSLPDISTQQGIYAGGIIGLCVPLVGWYFRTGRQWQ